MKWSCLCFFILYQQCLVREWILFFLFSRRNRQERDKTDFSHNQQQISMVSSILFSLSTHNGSSLSTHTHLPMCVARLCPHRLSRTVASCPDLHLNLPLRHRAITRPHLLDYYMPHQTHPCRCINPLKITRFYIYMSQLTSSRLSWPSRKPNICKNRACCNHLHDLISFSSCVTMVLIALPRRLKCLILVSP
jgi:hypothetical protein